MNETKVKLHEELNAAFAILLNICLILDLPAYYENLERGRSFMSRMVDHSDIKNV